MLEKTLESPLDSKEVQPVHPKGSQSWIFIGGTDAEAEAPILWPPDPKNWFLGKDPDPGKDWREEEKEMTEDEMIGWHHWLNGHEFEQALEGSEGQGNLLYYSPWGHRVRHHWLTGQQQQQLILPVHEIGYDSPSDEHCLIAGRKRAKAGKEWISFWLTNNSYLLLLMGNLFLLFGAPAMELILMTQGKPQPKIYKDHFSLEIINSKYLL